MEYLHLGPGLDGLDDKSDRLGDMMDSREDRHNFVNSIKISEDIRSAYFKVKFLTNTSVEEGDLQKEYDRVLTKYEMMFENGLTAQSEYLKIQTSLLDDLSNLETKGGQKLKDITIEGSVIQTAKYLYSGVQKAVEKIYDEIKGALDLILNPEQVLDIMKALGHAIVNPLEFFNNILNALKEFGGDIYRDILAIKKSTTPTGYVMEMSEYVPSTAIPLIVSSVGPGKFVKFLKILKIDKYIPDKIMSKLDNVGEKNISAVDKGKTDWLQMKASFKLADDVHPVQATKQINKFSEYLEPKFLMDDVTRGVESADIIEGMCDYIIRNGDRISELPAHQLTELKMGFNELRKKTVKIGNNENIDNVIVSDYRNLSENKMNQAFYILNPNLAPK